MEVLIQARQMPQRVTWQEPTLFDLVALAFSRLPCPVIWSRNGWDTRTCETTPEIPVADGVALFHKEVLVALYSP